VDRTVIPAVYAPLENSAVNSPKLRRHRRPEDGADRDGVENMVNLGIG